MPRRALRPTQIDGQKVRYIRYRYAMMRYCTRPSAARTAYPAHADQQQEGRCGTGRADAIQSQPPIVRTAPHRTMVNACVPSSAACKEDREARPEEEEKQLQLE
ncbi:uncharacterized protein PSFLO_02775 [Pseudozyma flocculosa]|uniref:Uncharacterized protein n=1 Tax=Pseudozyma flocculosa TaxID=84751 RepID=A0A5C3EZ13_9BASI|nr:uncharacterized protein PSFLO_02775 [Pseudozyma flocculosa]